MIKEIKFTDKAIKQINYLLAKKDSGTFFRIAILGGGCSGFKYDFSYEKKPEKEDHILNQVLIDKLAKTNITIEVQVGEEERIFGSVTAQDIQKSLEEKGITIDRSCILMEEPIKSLGVYNIPVKITADLESEIKVYVIKTI